MSDHDTESPLTPTELRTLCSEIEEFLVDNEMQFSHPDWRYVDGLRALASALERAVDPSRSTPEEVDPAVSEVSRLRSQLQRLEAEIESYELLKSAVNEHPGECDAECDSHGHTEGCKYCDMANTLIEQQRVIVRLRADLLTPEQSKMLVDLIERTPMKYPPEVTVLWRKLRRRLSSETGE